MNTYYVDKLDKKLNQLQKHSWITKSQKMSEKAPAYNENYGPNPGPTPPVGWVAPPQPPPYGTQGN